MQSAKIPVETESIGESHVMFKQEDGMPLMWATQAPMEQLKEMLVVRADGVRAVQGVQAIGELQAGRLQPGLSLEGGCNKSWNVLCDFEPVEKPVRTPESIRQREYRRPRGNLVTAVPSS